MARESWGSYRERMRLEFLAMLPTLTDAELAGVVAAVERLPENTAAAITAEQERRRLEGRPAEAGKLQCFLCGRVIGDAEYRVTSLGVRHATPQGCGEAR